MKKFSILKRIDPRLRFVYLYIAQILIWASVFSLVFSYFMNTKDPPIVLLKLIGFIWLGYLTVVVTTFSIHKGLKELEKKNLQQTKK